MKVEIKGKELIITVEMQTPAPSASGKTLVIASSHGNQTTTAIIDGKPVIVGLNAYIKKQAKAGGWSMKQSLSKDSEKCSC